MSNLRAAIVGAGAIGSRLDAPDAVTPLTHAGGYRAAGFDLTALVDVSGDVKTEAARWNCRSYTDFSTMMTAERPDVVSLCVPVQARTDLLRATLEFRPRLV